MKFYIPEWDDKVDAGYNFIKDEYSNTNSDEPRQEAYMWELFPQHQIPFDGILVSLMNIIGKKKKYQTILEKGGIRNFLQLPEKYPILADCGAWGYINSEEEGPPFDSETVFKHYKAMGVNEGVTVDHLVLPQIKKGNKTIKVDIQRRMDITYQNGIQGHNLWKKQYKQDFDLLVGVQGLETTDYIDMFKKYIEHDIDSFAFGGLAKKTTKKVVDIIDNIVNHIEENDPKIRKIHFFGLGRDQLFKRFQKVEKYGIITSFDTSSWLRQAWLGGNYHLIDQGQKENYTAIRVPFTHGTRSSFKGKRALVDEGNLHKLIEAEKNVMNALRDDENPEYINHALEQIKNYDLLVQHELSRSYQQNVQDYELKIKTMHNFYSKIEPKYSRVLKEKPWRKCDCVLCQEHGIDILIFRGNDRNRRRGFHNVYQIYYNLLNKPENWSRARAKKKFIESPQDLKKIDGKVLVLTGCTKSKTGYNAQTKTNADSLYTGRLFKAVKLYVKLRNFDLKIISAKYGLIDSDERIEGYEQALKTQKDIDRIKPQVTDRLTQILEKYDTVLVIAGKKYRKTLEDVWDDRFIYLKAGGYALMVKKVHTVIDEVIPSLETYLN